MKESGPFHFKEFDVYHSQSSMKVGVDAVLLGSWGNVNGSRGLDAGCGCGLIALMAAQRNTDACIDAIDIHSPSVIEAQSNFEHSAWARRLKALIGDINEFAERDENRYKYDFILSNPPYFSSGINNPFTAREIARHEGTLSPGRLIELSTMLLKEGGTVSIIMPCDRQSELEDHNGMEIDRICRISDRPGLADVRLMATLRKGNVVKKREEHLTIKEPTGIFSEEYKELTRPFYLKF